MLRVLTLSTLFPNASQPVFGVFVERQAIGLAALDGVEVQVVAPIGLPPGPLARHPHYRPRAALPERESWKSLTVHRPRFPVLPLVGERLMARSLARSLLPVLRELRKSFPFDVIDAEFFWPDGPTAMRLAAALDVPFSIKARGGDIHLWGARAGIGRQIVAAGRAADGLLAVSEALRDDMIALGMPGDAIRVHRTGIDSQRFAPLDRVAAKRALGVMGTLVVGLGALIARKGFDLAVEAVALLPDVTLLIAGEGPDRGRLEALILARGLASRVRLLGAQPHDALPPLLAAADAMVLPSASEGLANAWVESLACGTPIVVADAGGARELVDRPAAGRIVPRDPVAIARALAELIADPPEAAKVRATIAAYSWERNAVELRDHLAKITRR